MADRTLTPLEAQVILTNRAIHLLRNLTADCVYELHPTYTPQMQKSVQESVEFLYQMEVLAHEDLDSIKLQLDFHIAKNQPKAESALVGIENG